MPRDVIVVWNKRREHDALGRNTPRRDFAAQIVDRVRLASEQPENTSWARLQQPHPDVKHGRPNLVVLVEAAVHKARFRQTCFATRWAGRRNTAPGVIALVGIR